MRHIYNIIGIVGLFLLTACGQQHEAESLVSAFIAENAVSPEKIDIFSYGKLDSTKVIGDSLIADMQQRENSVFKKDVKYGSEQSGRMLHLLRINYAYEGDTLTNTFYMDEQLQHVVAFK